MILIVTCIFQFSVNVHDCPRNGYKTSWSQMRKIQYHLFWVVKGWVEIPMLQEKQIPKTMLHIAMISLHSSALICLIILGYANSYGGEHVWDARGPTQGCASRGRSWWRGNGDAQAHDGCHVQHNFLYCIWRQLQEREESVWATMHSNEAHGWQWLLTLHPNLKVPSFPQPLSQLTYPSEL